MKAVLLALGVFLAAVALDSCYTLWISAVHSNKIPLASLTSMAIGGLSLTGISAMLKKNYLVVIWLIGLGAGTALAMWLNLTS